MSGAGRRPRADSVRNREKVLEAAKLVLGAGGPQASLEAVAREAGVGIGTLYRHFPTREALFEAVYRREVEQLVELSGQLAADADPVAALRHWMRAVVDFAATKKGMVAALQIAINGSSPLAQYSQERLSGAIGSLVQRAIAEGAMRQDVGPEQLLRMLIGLCYGSSEPGWQDNVRRLLDVFIDGLRRIPAAA